MQYTLNELRQKMFAPVYDVYEIFKNFFDERYVDLQGIPSDETILAILSIYSVDTSGNTYEVTDRQLENIMTSADSARPYILVWWPSVRVTNENDKYIDIQDLYAKIEITNEGRIPYENTGFQLIRSTFSGLQLNERYIHSHVPRLNLNDIRFNNPCLGSGPIRHTIGDLKNNYEEALWMLFCQELSLYVTVESLTGGPYIRLEEVYSRTGSPYYNTYFDSFIAGIDYISHCCEREHINLMNVLKEFTGYFLSKNNLPISFKDNEFVCGLPYFDFMITISNAFIEWVNQNGTPEMVNTFWSSGVLLGIFAKQGKFYRTYSGCNLDYSQYEGTPILNFKGRDITLHIYQTDNSDETCIVTLIEHRIAMFILQQILKTINYHYRNEYKHNNRGQDSTPAPTYKTVCYL